VGLIPAAPYDVAWGFHLLLKDGQHATTRKGRHHAFSPFIGTAQTREGPYRKGGSRQDKHTNGRWQRKKRTSPVEGTRDTLKTRFRKLLQR